MKSQKSRIEVGGMNTSAQFIFPGIVALVAMIACIGTASAETKTWNGGSATSNNWRTNDNWGGAPFPVTGDDIVFAGGNRTTSVNNNNGTTQMVWAKSITFDSTAH